jgi:phthalate 4,5-cis-dihydrodiol dehydrogenase
MDRPKVLRFGVVGIGNAGGGVLKAIQKESQIEAVAVADTRPHAREAFEKEFGGKAYATVDELYADPNVDAVWIATPNPFHAPHTIAAANAGKHIVVEKPLALDLKEASAMIEAADKNGVKLLSGHTRAFDPPVQTMSQIIKTGEVGELRAMNVWSFTNWMLRPRMPEEVDVTKGGGVGFRQAPHQIDTLRFLGGGLVKSVRGNLGTWMKGRMGAPGYYTAYLEFEDGMPATIAYNGYGYFMASELLPWEVESAAISPEARAKTRAELQGGTWNEEAAKDDMRFGGAAREQWRPGEPSTNSKEARFLSDLGLLLLTCDQGLLRQGPNGIYVYNDQGVREEPIHLDDAAGGADPTFDEAYRGIVHGEPIFHDGHWGMATLEVQLALMQSARERKEIPLQHQVAVRGH